MCSGEIGTTSDISSRVGELAALAPEVLVVVVEVVQAGTGLAVAIVTVVVLVGLWLLW